MEDIRLFSLSPSYRLSDDGNDSLDNSSDTERPKEGSQGELLASVKEEGSHNIAQGILEQYVTANDQPDKERFLGDWFTSAGAPLVPEVSGTDGSISGDDEVSRASGIAMHSFRSALLVAARVGALVAVPRSIR